MAAATRAQPASPARAVFELAPGRLAERKFDFEDAARSVFERTSKPESRKTSSIR